MVHKQTVSSIIAGVLFSVGLFILLSLLIFLLSENQGFLLVPGAYLYHAFSVLSFYIPVYLFAAGYLLLLPVVRKDIIIVLTGTAIPFFFFSLFARIAFREIRPGFVAELVRILGIPAALLVSFLAGMISVLLLIRMFSTLSVLKEKQVLGNRANYSVKIKALSAPEENTDDVFAGADEEDGPDSRISAAPRLKPLDDSPLFNEYVEPEDAVVESFPNTDDEDTLILMPEDDGPLHADLHEVRKGQDPVLHEGPGEAEEKKDNDLWHNPYGHPLMEKGGARKGQDKVPANGSGPAASSGAKPVRYEVPADGLLGEYHDGEYWIIDEETRKMAITLTETLQEFRIEAEVTGIRKGPVITMFEILPAPGVKLSKISNLADNIALRLAASPVRIVAPIPGKHAVGIEVPNKKRNLVSFREMVTSEAYTDSNHALPIILGKDITGEVNIIDLTQTPHLLIAGATGSGKSVCVNSIICSILYTKTPAEAKMILIDPKIVELKLYNDIPHLLTPVITEPKKAFQALQYCIYEMERRYSLLDSLGVRDIGSFNRKIKTKHLTTEQLPYLIVIVDEFADLMATTGKELESTLARLAAMSRAVGIHLVLATQRPSIDVITGLIKANIPSRIAFMVAGKFDSRIIIDAVGAEKLLGRGDMLFSASWDPNPVRIQGAYLTDDEVENVTDHIKTLGQPDYIDDEIFIDDEDSENAFFSDGGIDPLMEKALDVLRTSGKASASYLQRRLKIGYNRAARLIEDMEARGIVGPANGSKPRDILHLPDRIEDE
ncbi:MAG: DNA translocase FtsK [Spirochaetales bacterium]|nr:DNA translocase FtsK [Spirochaetales bacterium]